MEMEQQIILFEVGRNRAEESWWRANVQRRLEAMSASRNKIRASQIPEEKSWSTRCARDKEEDSALGPLRAEQKQRSSLVPRLRC